MINMCCENCLHSELSATEQPCRDCIRTLDIANYWESCNAYEEQKLDICCTHANIGNYHRAVNLA